MPSNQIPEIRRRKASTFNIRNGDGIDGVGEGRRVGAQQRRFTQTLAFVDDSDLAFCIEQLNAAAENQMNHAIALAVPTSPPPPKQIAFRCLAMGAPPNPAMVAPRRPGSEV